jgi:hypothetical protein
MNHRLIHACTVLRVFTSALIVNDDGESDPPHGAPRHGPAFAHAYQRVPLRVGFVGVLRHLPSHEARFVGPLGALIGHVGVKIGTAGPNLCR